MTRPCSKECSAPGLQQAVRLLDERSLVSLLQVVQREAHEHDIEVLAAARRKGQEVLLVPSGGSLRPQCPAVHAPQQS